MLQAIQFHFEITRFTQRPLSAILLVEIASISLALNTDQEVWTFRFIATMMMVGNVVLG